MMVMFASPALAHHPITTAGQECADGKVVINYTSKSWQSGSGHSKVFIEVRVENGAWTKVAEGAFNAGNNYQFSGSVPGDAYVGKSIQVRSQVQGAWDNGVTGGNDDPAATTARFKVDIECIKDVSISVTAGACVVNSNGEAVGTASVTIDPNAKATVRIYNNPSYSGSPVATVTSSGAVNNLAPGTYYWKAEASSGYKIKGSSEGQFTIPKCDVSVSVVANACVPTQGSALGSATVTIDPNSKATVKIYDNPSYSGSPVATVASSGAVNNLAPGTYYWKVDGVSTGFELKGPSSGSFEIVKCQVSVVVVSKACSPDDQGVALGSVEINLDPTSGATVKVYSGGQEVLSTATGGSFDLPPGSYTWSATAGPGFELTGTTSGSFTIEPCATTVVVGGSCVLDGDTGSGVISVTISVPGSVTVTVKDGDTVVDTLTSSGTVSVPEGKIYTWSAVAGSGFTITGASSGTVDIDDCTRSILVEVSGVCENNAPILRWTVTPVNFDDVNQVTVIWNDIDPENDPLGVRSTTHDGLSGQMDWPGTVRDSGGTVIDWAGWVKDANGVWSQADDGYQDTRPTTSITFSVNPTLTVDGVVYPGGEPECEGPPGEIIVEKIVLGDNPDTETEFAFVTENFVLADSTLSHGQSSSSGPVFPGPAYSVTETVPEGWTMVGATCDNGSTPSDIEVASGEVVTCTFTNQEVEDTVLASILVTISSGCDDESGAITVTMSVAGGANVTVRRANGSVVGTLSADGVLAVADNATYTWSATPNEGFSFPPGADQAGTLAIDDCSDDEVEAGELPFTGVDADVLAIVSMLLLGAGGVILATTRERRKET